MFTPPRSPKSTVKWILAIVVSVLSVGILAGAYALVICLGRGVVRTPGVERSSTQQSPDRRLDGMSAADDSDHVPVEQVSEELGPDGLAETPERGSMIVKVVSETSLDPVVGMRLGITQRTSGFEVEYVTDSNGLVRLDDLPVGVVAVATATGKSATVEVNGGSCVEVEIVMPAGLTVCGLVVDSLGSPVSGAEIWAWRYREESLAHLVGMSAADGSFTLRHLGDGHYIDARRIGSTPSHSYRIISDQDASMGIQLKLGADVPVIRGRVIDSERRPVPGAYVFAGRIPGRGRWTGRDTRSWWASKSDEEGAFELSSESGDEPSVLWVRQFGFAPYRRDVEPAECGAPLQVQLCRGGRISGVVRGSDGRGVGNASVVVLGNGWEASHSFDGPDWVKLRCLTDESGNFVLNGIPAGTWRVIATYNGEAVDHSISLVDDANEGINFDLRNLGRRIHESGNWSGRIRDVSGHGVDRLSLSFRPDDGCEPSSTQSSSEGAFRIEKACEYGGLLLVFDAALVPAPEVARRHLDQAGASVQIDLSYERPYARLRGQLADGEPGMEIAIEMDYGELELSAHVVVDSNGEFVSGDVLPGQCTIKLWAQGRHYNRVVQTLLHPGSTMDVGVFTATE